MRTLYLCRHAKSSWANPGQDDFDRPLNERGLRDAPFMAKTFKARDEPVDLLVSSTANRAFTTARFFAKELGAKERPGFDAAQPRPQLVLESNLYHASVRGILAIVNGLPNEAAGVMLFGHNPGFTEAVEFLSSRDIENMPTCGIVRIDFPFRSWAEVSMDMGMLEWFDYPKRYGGEE